MIEEHWSFHGNCAEDGLNIMRLKKEIEILKQAVMFYADKEIYAPIGHSQHFRICPKLDTDSIMVAGFQRHVAGKRARQALKEIELKK